jgi:[ribosomal protein S18]-alanine N-acetyltransferase
MYYFIEPMTEDDIPSVQDVERQSFTTPWSASTYRRELRHPATSRYIVVRASPTPPPPRVTRPTAPRRSILALVLPTLFHPMPAFTQMPLVGYGGLWLTEKEAHVTTIAVAKSHRGHSVGELLLNGLIDHAIDLRATWLSLEVRVSNQVAQNLYLKYGFRPSGTRARYYTDNGEDALMMWTDPIQTLEYQTRLRELRERLFIRLRERAEAAERDSSIPQVVHTGLRALRNE